VEPLNNRKVFVFYREAKNTLEFGALKKCPLLGGVLYTECPLLEVPLLFLPYYSLFILHQIIDLP